MRSICLGPIVGRVGEMWAMRLGTITLVLGLAAYPFVRTLWGLAAVIPFVPVGTALLFPATSALLSGASDKAQTGLIMGIAQTYAGVARMISPVIATFLFERFGHGTPFYVSAAIVALVGAMAFRMRPPERAATHQA
jgi:MFS family permease